MTKFKKVEDHPGLVKDDITGQILNINKDKIAQTRALRAQKKKEREEFETLKSDVNYIKVMLKKLLENGTNG